MALKFKSLKKSTQQPRHENMNGTTPLAFCDAGPMARYFVAQNSSEDFPFICHTHPFQW
jgi:hypothetical protein